MNNGDYIPLDQKVIEENIKRFENNRKAMIAKILRDDHGNRDIIVIKADEEKRKIVNLVDSLNLTWFKIGGDIYMNRHEFNEAIGIA